MNLFEEVTLYASICTSDCCAVKDIVHWAAVTLSLLICLTAIVFIVDSIIVHILSDIVSAHDVKTRERAEQYVSYLRNGDTSCAYAVELKSLRCNVFARIAVVAVRMITLIAAVSFVQWLQSYQAVFLSCILMSVFLVAFLAFASGVYMAFHCLFKDVSIADLQ